MRYHKHPDRNFRHLIAAPFIYFMIIPVAFLDLTMEIYHRICFPLYGIPYVDRSKYVFVDRHRLKYLGIIDKVNCAYCGYVNGVLPYSAAIAHETERYWCSILHEGQKPKEGFEDYLPYGDEKAFEDYTKNS